MRCRISLALLLLVLMACEGDLDPQVEGRALTTVVPCGGGAACAPAFRHWRTLGVARISTPTALGSCSSAVLSPLAKKDGVLAAPIACSGGAGCVSPTDLQFVVPDFAAVADAFLIIDGGVTGPDALHAFACLDGTGALHPIAPSRNHFPTPGRLTFDVPARCLGQRDVTVRITSAAPACLTADFAALRVYSSYRRVPVASVAAPTPSGTCGAACWQDLDEDDEQQTRWIACNAQSAYNNPTTIRYRVPDHASVTRAQLTLETSASGSDARASIDCVRTDGSVLASIQGTRLFPSARAHHSWPVPTACFASPDVSIRVTRVGNNCLGPDLVALDVEANTLAEDDAAPPLDRDNDGQYSSLACGGTWSATTFPEGSPTHRAWAVLDVRANGADARFRFTCSRNQDAPTTVIPSTLISGKRTFTIELPPPCLGNGTGQARLELHQEGADCLSVDYLRWYFQLAGPNGKLPAVANGTGLYFDRDRANPGESLELRVSGLTDETLGPLHFERLGGTERSVLGPWSVSRRFEPELAPLFGAGWPTTDTFTLPTTWRSGYYRVTSPVEGVLADVIVGESVPGASPLAVLAPTLSWYGHNFHPNTRGGRDLDSPGEAEDLRPSTSWVSLEQPRSAPFLAWRSDGHVEEPVPTFLEAQGLAYAALTDQDLHLDGSRLWPHRALILHGESDLWTREMMDAIDEYQARGGSVLNFGGRSMRWKVTIGDGRIERRTSGHHHQQSGELGGQWRDLARPPAARVGLEYAGESTQCDQALQVTLPEHWIFQDTGASTATSLRLGVQCLAPLGARTPNTPAQHQLLAQDLRGVPNELIYFDHPGGGGVLSIGSSLWLSDTLDPKVEVMTRNAIERLTEWRRIPISTVSSPAGSCNASCARNLNHDDGRYLDGSGSPAWMGCNPAGTDSPTDFRFQVLDAATVTEADLTIDAKASGNNTIAEIFCTSPSGQRLATISSARSFPAAATYHRLAVPTACFAAGPEITIRIARTTTGCWGPDYLSLAVRSGTRRIGVDQVQAATSCADPAACRRRMNLDDDDYLSYVACSSTPGSNGPTEYANPTVVQFRVPGPAPVGAMALLADLYGSGNDARVNLSCLDASGATVASIAGTQAYSTQPRVYTFPVPASCLQNGLVRVRFNRVGSHCLSVDQLRLEASP